MNRYEILIGKILPPEPPKPPTPVREILIGKRRSGKTLELINCIRKTVKKGITPLVCVHHKPDYFLDMAGELRHHFHLITKDGLERGCRGLGGIKVFYYDDFDLVNFYKSVFHDIQFGLEKYSLDRRFVEMDEIIVTCDMQEVHRYCQVTQMEMPAKIKLEEESLEITPLKRSAHIDEVLGREGSERSFNMGDYDYMMGVDVGSGRILYLGCNRYTETFQCSIPLISLIEVGLYLYEILTKELYRQQRQLI